MTQEPLFNIAERAPVYLCAILILIFAATSYLPTGLILSALNACVLVPLDIQGRDTAGHGFSLLAHGFLHGSWSHVLMNSAMIVAFGVVTIRGAKLFAASRGKPAKGELTFIIIFLLGVVGGGLAQWLYWASIGSVSSAALGASGGASALFATGAWAMGGQKKLLSFGLGWLFINFVLVVAEPLLGVSIAWAAHIGGYVTGAILAPFMIRANSTVFSVTR